ncbi:type III restriction/modification enzyme restriction subunit [Arcticibacter tournemirensis]|uniref:Helicase n=1 Tax=Arcticibacter tournemirensis TaxID=699437 RepID=A0A5M9HLJ7_9SPHI|nr:helicase-related protein [Arcticibacter tournemirensis]KAA8485877.1 helicase [Arcticibacter tournemirensis]TQM46870.1 type III restriction/modification enzyme restriction subunit [Arcticibacter tournemirensis]
MILDNENENLKVHEWIASYTEQGKLDIVTGYFTIGALAWLSKTVNDKISDFRLVLGDIVNVDSIDNRPLDLLNENISIEASLKLSSISKEAVAFLKQDKVVAKTLEPNFCHAKSYLFNPLNKDDRAKYFISGSSNLTEAGIGLKHTNNIELNIAETGNSNQYKELVEWFEALWIRPQAHKEKTLVAPDGTKSKIDFKQYLINEIEKIFITYTPRELYYKVLFELFGNQLLETENDPDFNRQIGRLENSIVYNTLYEFQKKGVLSLIRMLQKYNGAILADAVGLGKTWSALAVIKFFQLQGREVLLLCPKKLDHNWRRYLKHQDSRFEKDQFDFFLRFHTDMHEERVEKYIDRADKYFTNDKPKLIVIDESHNLRNDKSNRYKFLLERILKENEDIKVLLLSATPINNSLNDIRNQFKLMLQGDVGGYEETLSIRNLDYTFRTAQKVFNEWREEPRPRISDFIKKLPANFFTLTDSLIVARTRKMIEGQQTGLAFPTKSKPVNLFVTPSQLGNFESFEELFDHFPPMLSGYQPSFYLEEENEEEKDILHDERQRDRFLVKMLYILMVKRLESSWFSFQSTVEKIKDHHQNALDKIKAYQEGRGNSKLNEKNENLFYDDNLQDDYEELTLGKKRKINLSDIDAAGNLENFKKDLKKDLDALGNLFINLQKFENKIQKETIRPGNLNSSDDKLQALIAEINKKRASGENNSNLKVVIFTVYRDTAQYLFNQLKSRGFDKLALVSGTGSQTSDSEEETKNFEPILERFAPFTKLFKEKEWDFHTTQKGIEAYHEWITWIAQNHPKTYTKVQQSIDILIATDALSEGQNLQDADMVINYDIHWNPVRIIQRLGRIDRLGSPNKKIFGINFWPSNNINSYLNLQKRIEHRMAAMKLTGSEVDEAFSETFQEMVFDESLDQRMNNRMMEQMQVTLEDLDGEKTFGFDHLSLEKYRQDLLEEFNKDKAKYLRMPKGVYTGFKADTTVCAENGLIALLGYPARPAKAPQHAYTVFDLIYINEQGKLVLLNQKDVLDALTHHKDKDRFVPDAVDKGDDKAIQKLVNAIKAWLDSQAAEEQIQTDGSTKKVMGTEAKDLLSKLRKGDKEALSRVRQNVRVDEKFQLDNFDLITWFLVTA